MLNLEGKKMDQGFLQVVNFIWLSTNSKDILSRDQGLDTHFLYWLRDLSLYHGIRFQLDKTTKMLWVRFAVMD